MEKLEDQIPGLREAIERENSAWDAAWLGLNESICGIEVKPFTPRHDLILGRHGTRSAFLAGGVPSSPRDLAIECMRFMWVIAPTYQVKERGFLANLKVRLERRRFLKAVRNTDALKLVVGIRKYVAEAFEDAPGGSGVRDASFHSWLSQAVDLFGKEYGWAREAVIDMPLKQMFQLYKCIQRRKDPSCVLFKPSDKVSGAWLAEQNEKAKAG